MSPTQVFNRNLAVSGNTLPLYRGEMTLVPHQGIACSGTGTLELACRPGNRYIGVTFYPPATQTTPTLPGSADGKFGSGTSLMRLPLSDDFFVFVTAGPNPTLHGESRLVIGGSERECASFSVHLLNCLIPGSDVAWTTGDWRISSTQTACSYDLARVSMPAYEINLTHTLTVTRRDRRSFPWSQVESTVTSLLAFLGFINCSPVTAPVTYGYDSGRAINCFRFEAPQRSVPTNRRTWATDLSDSHLQDAFSSFLKATESPFWATVLRRAIEWQILTETVDSQEQALFTVQMLLEMLSFAVLVEDAEILGADGYSKLPASDKITLLCGHTGQNVTIDFRGHLHAVSAFCEANSINNIGELISQLRNKLIHPTKNNREYLDRVPPVVRWAAVQAGIQIASLVLLKAMNYKREYYDIIDHETRLVPWA